MEQPIRIEDEVQFLDPQRLKISRNQFAELEAELPDGYSPRTCRTSAYVSTDPTRSIYQFT